MAEEEGLRLGLSPAARDEAYGRVLIELVNKGVRCPDQNLLAVLRRLCRCRATDVARTRNWGCSEREFAARLEHRNPCCVAPGPDLDCRAAELRRAMTALAPDEMRILLERYWCGWTYGQIARAFDLRHHEQGRRLVEAARRSLVRRFGAQGELRPAGVEPTPGSLVERASCRLTCPHDECPWV